MDYAVSRLSDVFVSRT